MTATLPAIERALVIGTGASARSAVRLLRAVGVPVLVVDERDAGVPAELLAEPGVEVVVGRAAHELFTAGIELVVPSPGVPEHAPVLRAAASAGVPVWSEPELALRCHPRRLLAVTGTNGKTSTTELLTAMLRADGRDARACGNIGPALGDVAAASPMDAWLVAELSSFQLRFTEQLAPDVAVIVNLAPDHLDWHGDLAAYTAAKARIFAAQGPQQWAVANLDDPLTLTLRDAAPAARPAAFSATQPVAMGVGRADGVLTAELPGVSVPLLACDELSPPGVGVPPHRVANVAAAATVALLAGAAPSAVRDAALAWAPGQHRFEVVAVDPRGVRFVNDSKATNPHAAQAALAAAGPGVWIAGGLAKGLDLGVLADALGQVHDAVLIGTAAEELATVCALAQVTVHRADDLPSAVARAAGLAAPGETVLLAPACASFDQFDSYEQRGQVFTTAARAVAGEAS